MFGIDDEHLFRLFDTEERDVVVEAIFGAHDQPALGHLAPPGRRAELANKLRQRLLGSIDAYIDRLHGADAGFNATEFHSALCLKVEIERVAAGLADAEGKVLTGDGTAALAYSLRDAWTAFMGDAAARSIFIKERAELVKRAKRSETNKKNASKPRPGARAIDHDDANREINRLVREGFTEREARGRIAMQSGASQSTIHRISKKTIR